MNQILHKNTEYEIFTPSGWQNFEGIVRSKKIIVKIEFSNGTKFRATPEHKIFANNDWVTISNIRVGDTLNNKIVISVDEQPEEYVYDPINVNNGNVYISDDFISHNCQFLGSSLTLICADTISRMSLSSPFYSKEGLDLYEKPKKLNTYVLVADTAKGVGGDYSAFVIIDITEAPYKLVGKYRNNTISPLLYPNMIYQTGKQFNSAYVLIEINSSEQVPYILYNELEYDNLIFVNRTASTQVVSGGFGGGKCELGVTTDKRVKRIGCQNLKSLLEENKLIVNDADIISEISTFIETKGSYAADEGYHDDLVMGLVLFSWLTTNSYFKDLNNINLRELMYKKQMQAIEDELTPFGIYDNGIIEEEVLANF